MKWFPNAPMLGYFMLMEQIDFERIRNEHNTNEVKKDDSKRA